MSFFCTMSFFHSYSVSICTWDNSDSLLVDYLSPTFYSLLDDMGNIKKVKVGDVNKQKNIIMSKDLIFTFVAL